MKNKSATVRRFIERVLSGGDIEATDEYFWDDMLEEVPFPGQGPGVDGLKEVLKGMRGGFPDMNWIVEEQIEDGDKVVTRFTWTGTHQGTFLGIPATGRSVTVWGMVIDLFEGEKIKSTRIIMDILGLMAQLGVFPPPEQAGSQTT
ncbi:MAG: ester cyclase [Akkermansiaceae bacterium]|nr:ester cyclase [Akkermansiaceae bacterium]